MNNLIIPKIETKDGQLVVSSRIIAEQLGKRHSDVLESLGNILENGDFRSLILSSSYNVEGQHREYKEYLLTRDGFTLYMFNIQGYNDFKMAYINRFNEMERQLKSTFRVPQTFKEALLLAVEQQEKIEQQEKLLIEQKPKVDFYDVVVGSDKLVDVGEVAKIINLKGIGRNKLFEILRDENILMKNNIPYQKYIDMEHFEVIETTKNTPSGNLVFTKTMVTQKGIDFIFKTLKKIKNE